ncbi:MAG: beta-ketoacyl-ACP synthase II [Frankiaceae bacterium]
MTARPQVPVVVTGLGATTPLGGDVPSTWRALLDGRSGVRHLTDEWAQGLPVRIAAPVAVEPSTVLDRVEARTLDRVQQLAVVAAREAWADAGEPQADAERLAVVVATGIGGVLTLMNQYDILREKGPRRVSPHTVPMLMANGAAAAVGLRLGARAGVHTPVSACASGAEAIALGLDLIRAGRADIVVAGGAEACIHALPMAAFASMRALSTAFEETPEAASRPYDKQRDGFVLGEGAGMLVLESAEHAAARGARVHATVLGAGISNDAHHVAQPDPTGAGARRAIELALADGGVRAEEIVHINAHATSTPQGDLAEAIAIRTVLGAAADRVAVSATKSMTGHLLGAAGAVEAIATVLALTEGKAPAIRNLEDPDDEVDLDLVRIDPRDLPGTADGRPARALSNSFGFGGHNVALVIGAVA